MPTGIEWTEETLNPWVGCTPVSPGCANCYARRLVEGRLKCRYLGGFGKLHFHMERLEQLRHWTKPRMVFMWSMSDPFDDRVAPRYLFNTFREMAMAGQHTFQTLTKRPERMNWIVTHFGNWWPSNVWAGVSVENQEWADKRLPLLAQVPAKVRFVSLEPLLGPVDLSPWLQRHHTMPGGELLPVLSWVIVGGESGPNARPMHPDWVRSIRDQCQEGGGVPFFFKQWGEWAPCGFIPGLEYGQMVPDMQRIGKKAAGALLDGKEHREWPRRERS